MKAWLRSFFGFSKTEINGTLVLLSLCCLSLIVPWGLQWYCRHQPIENYDQDTELLERTLATLEAQKSAFKRTPCREKRYHQYDQPLSRLDINTVTEDQLRTIQGIGPVLSDRIIKFRNRLGGFVRQVQYEEVYGLSPTVLDRLKHYTYISTDFRPDGLDINKLHVRALATHPYITYQQAHRIVHYRIQKGPFDMVEELLDAAIVEEATFNKLRPYLCAS